jgi:hypothetical protein
LYVLYLNNFLKIEFQIWANFWLLYHGVFLQTGLEPGDW